MVFLQNNGILSAESLIGAHPAPGQGGESRPVTRAAALARQSAERISSSQTSSDRKSAPASFVGTRFNFQASGAIFLSSSLYFFLLCFGPEGSHDPLQILFPELPVSSKVVLKAETS